MADVEKREKVIRGIEACNRQSYNGSDCQNCPYYDDEDTAELPFGICNIQDMFDDAIALLKGQEAKVIELSEISPNIYVWLEDRDDGTVFPLKGGVIDPDGDDYFRFDADFGEDFVYYPTGHFGKHWRVWDKCPTEEQRKAVAWDG